jgi:hypothetical protein
LKLASDGGTVTGLYWLIPAAVAGPVGGVVNAWPFLVNVTSQSTGGGR